MPLRPQSDVRSIHVHSLQIAHFKANLSAYTETTEERDIGNKLNVRKGSQSGQTDSRAEHSIKQQQQQQQQQQQRTSKEHSIHNPITSQLPCSCCPGLHSFYLVLSSLSSLLILVLAVDFACAPMLVIVGFNKLSRHIKQLILLPLFL
ncbi:hypothetical protein ACLKA7_013574 [Drosophila subpalustris]